MSKSLSIAFQGAARTVTGSRHRLRFGDRSWLFDCGLYQGHREEADRVNRTFAEAPAELDTVVVSHAHLDHSGNLPTLVAHGYGGRIHVTPATAELCTFMLEDSAFLQEKDVTHLRRHHPGKPTRAPLYTPADVEQTVARFDVHPYHQPWQLFDDVTVQYFDAGHILGSALTTFDFERNGTRFRVGMSGDLGRAHMPILKDPEVHPGVDALVLESTYGNRTHPERARSDQALAETVERTASRGGRVLLPAFAVGRTQEVVATLHDLMETRRIPELPIFVDSPMARQATEVFMRHPELFDGETRRAFEHERGAPFGFERLRYIATPQESKSLNDHAEPCVIVAASGMCEGGRILHHLQHGLGEARNTVLFVGFQAEGTLGRRLVDGAEAVNVFGVPVRVRAGVTSLQGFSAHADQNELTGWVERMRPTPRRIFLVHGELEAAEALRGRLHERTGADVRIPEPGEEFTLWT
ncbi:MAG: MBL fold metallo-hydrolase [Candidatus Eisenbacteria bacterium]|uniref:MBL fold metallo-hydrolase n=1 Tax=Eiseniibacteriota bacterium TaxID=2212470 RepID=A0A538U4Q6_UNCEI|nr:MAG: MBL fold metallo-hydrolase [Candidatus Eisenbacteria bacterium]